MIELKDLFDVITNKRIVLSSVKRGPYNFISTQTENMGVSGKIEELPKEHILHQAGMITVSVEGSILNAFVQPDVFYANDVVRVLYPKDTMSLREKYFYCLAISKNKYRYNYGRKAYKTLSNILLPSRDEIPLWIYSKDLPDYSYINKPIIDEKYKLQTNEWSYFKLEDIFDISIGNSSYSIKESVNGFPLISATTKNNGVSKLVSKYPNYLGNTITIASNGKPGVCFYQPISYNAVPDITILSSDMLNQYIGLFFVTVLSKEQYRFNYGRKFTTSLIKKHKIKLPAVSDEVPDWHFMEQYIKSMNYSHRALT